MSAMSATNNHMVSVRRGQLVRYPDHGGAIRATVEQIREIRTARTVEQFTGLDKDIVLTLQMDDGMVSARPWQVIF
ncbi:MAG TPA: hypothetical protein PLG59_11295 [bacterium]|nr:hypothetical protein [bacterium]HQO35241.1 hypothetical protein [bacterium]HQP98319.1 hypothetical protein [bacterium]